MRGILLACALLLGAGQAVAGEWSVVSAREESKGDRRYLYIEVMSSDLFPHPLRFMPVWRDKNGKNVPFSLARTIARSSNSETFSFFTSEELLARSEGVVFELTISAPGSEYRDLHVSIPVGKEKPAPGAAPHQLQPP